MPNSTLYAFILSFLAGLSTFIGALIMIICKNKDNRVVIGSLSFAAGVMICVSISDLIPNSYKLININDTFFKILLCLIFIVIGIIISMLIDKYITDEKVENNNNLYKVGIISMIAIIMHNIPEGIATFITSSNNIKLGITLTLAIALHNIPEGISIFVPIYYSTNNKLKAFLYVLISGMSEVIGAILAYLFLAPFINDFIMSLLYSIIAGIMIHISVYELIPKAYELGTLKQVLKYFTIGFILMLLSHFILG